MSEESQNAGARENEKYSIVTLRRLFVLERENSPEVIAAVLAEDDELKSSFLSGLGSLHGGDLSDITPPTTPAVKP